MREMFSQLHSNNIDLFGSPVTLLRTGAAVNIRFTRVKTINPQNAMYKQYGRATLDSGIQCGDMLQDGTEYWLTRVVSKRKHMGEDACLDLQFWKCNVEVTVKRLTETADTSGNPAKTWAPVGVPVRAYQEYVSTALRDKDPGILPSTVRRLAVQSTVGIQLLDRIEIGVIKLQVDAVNNIDVPGISLLQLSMDIR